MGDPHCGVEDVQAEVGVDLVCGGHVRFPLTRLVFIPQFIHFVFLLLHTHLLLFACFTRL